MRIDIYVLTCTLALFAGCSGCPDDDLVNLPDPSIQRDVLAQKKAAQIDILWVVDNSESMRNEQRKLSNAFTGFLNTLIEADVDYQIGVVTTDAHEMGVLRAYNGPTVPGCDACRFLSTEVPCASAQTGDLDEIEEDELAALCAAQLVFKRLIQPGVTGFGFEEGFRQAAWALGIIEDSLEPLVEPRLPESNTGFLRPDADLLVVFVSDEDEADKRDGLPVAYFERLFNQAKGQGDERRLLFASVIGWDPAASIELQDLCDDLNDDVSAQAAYENLLSAPGCVDNEELSRNPQSRTAAAEVGRRYIDLTCRFSGTLVNICDADYSTGLERVGATASSLRRKFVVSRLADMNFGDDGLPFTEDDCVLDCNENGRFDDAVDEVICVKGVPYGAEDTVLVPRSEDGYRFEPATGSIVMDGAFLAAPGTSLEVAYRVGAVESCAAKREE